MKKFTLSDISKLKEALETTTKNNDRFTDFLKGFTFDDIYMTEDDTKVYETKGIHIEVFQPHEPMNRSVEVMYQENGEYKILFL